MNPIYWTTEEPHFDNIETMNDFLENENILDITLIKGNYAEGVNCRGEKYEIHAAGNGNSYDHVAKFRLINE